MKITAVRQGGKGWTVTISGLFHVTGHGQTLEAAVQDAETKAKAKALLFGWHYEVLSRLERLA
jgi:hypothetical protein